MKNFLWFEGFPTGRGRHRAALKLEPSQGLPPEQKRQRHTLHWQAAETNLRTPELGPAWRRQKKINKLNLAFVWAVKERSRHVLRRPHAEQKREPPELHLPTRCFHPRTGNNGHLKPAGSCGPGGECSASSRWMFRHGVKEETSSHADADMDPNR